jgi:hypothetical protein
MLSINDKEDKLDNVLKGIGGKHPLLYRLFLRNKVSLETMVILDDLVGYSKLWKRYDDMMLNDFLFLMEKYRPFLHNAVLIDKSKYRKLTLDIFA